MALRPALSFLWLLLFVVAAVAQSCQSPEPTNAFFGTSGWIGVRASAPGRFWRVNSVCWKAAVSDVAAYVEVRLMLNQHGVLYDSPGRTIASSKVSVSLTRAPAWFSVPVPALAGTTLDAASIWVALTITVANSGLFPSMYMLNRTAQRTLWSEYDIPVTWGRPPQEMAIYADAEEVCPHCQQCHGTALHRKLVERRGNL
eukprot:m51a1_g6005 hypothetical protein (200) ;mRNA; r:35570-36500